MCSLLAIPAMIFQDFVSVAPLGGESLEERDDV